MTASTYVSWVLKSVLEGFLVSYKYCNRAASESKADELTVTALMVQFSTPKPHSVGQGLREEMEKCQRSGSEKAG